MPSIPPGFVSWLGAEFPDLDVERVEKYWDSHHPILISAEEFSHELSIPIEDSTQILDFLASAGYLVEEKRKGCPICADHIPPNEISEDVCPGCGAPVKLAEFSEEVAFRRDGHRTRDFRWMVTIHGMNTRGAWQEDFSFQVSRVYGYSIPIAVFKYGRLLVSPFLELMRMRYTSLVSRKLLMHQNLLDQEGPSSPPDVLAHSFGTWLIGNLLLTSTDVRLGRLVLTGSILPPNFPWDRLIQEGKVQAVLCHTAGKDCWARAAHFFIPKSGPSGCIGFSSALVTHIHEMDFRHSSFFQRHRLQECFDKTWAPFLTDPNPCPGDPSIRALRWSPSWARIITFPVVILVALLLLLILLAIAYFAIIGVLSLKGA